MLDQRQYERGYRLLGEWRDGHSGSGSEWVHLQFHMAVFELELGYRDEAFARFTDHVLPVAATSADAPTDAPALAWRLWLADGSPADFSWEVVRRAAAERIDRHDDPWVDLHNVLPLAGAVDLTSLDRWLESRRRRAATR